MDANTQPNPNPPQSNTQTGQPAEPSKLPLDKYLLSLKKNLTDTYKDQAETRINNIVTSCRRYRGSSPSDLFGFFSGRGWATHKAHFELHSTNQFQSLITGASVSYLSAKIQLDVTATSQDPRSRSIEKISKGIYKTIDTRDWNEISEKQMFFGGVLQLNYIIESRFNKDCDDEKLKIPKFSQVPMTTGGQYVCKNYQCNQNGPMSDIEQNGACPQCQSPVEVLSPPVTQPVDVHTGYDEIPAGATEMEVSGGWYWEVDPGNTECSNIKKARWVKKYQIVHVDELKRKYPHLKCEARTPFSYAMKWILAFERGKDNALGIEGKEDLEKREVQKFWFDKDMVEGYISPSFYQVGNFQIQPGQKLTDVCPDGLVTAFTGEEICYIDNEDKRNTLTAGCWKDDPTSFTGLGVLSAIPIQKKINRLENILWEGLTRSMFGSVIYNPEAFENGKLEGNNRNIALKKGWPQNQPIDYYFRELNISGFSPQVQEYLQLQFDLMQKIMGVPDAAIGEADTSNTTYGGQQLLANRATGLVIPAKKSQAKAKEDWLLQQLQLVQKYYAPERIVKMGGRFGEAWTEEDIQAFMSADLCNEIIIEYKEGSEVPQTRAEQEQKLGALYGLGVFQEGNPTKPEILKELVDLSGVNVSIDFNGYDSNNKLAERRYEIMKEAIDSNPNADQIFMQMQAAAGINPQTGQPNPNPFIGQILANPTMQVGPDSENHQQMIDFWSRQMRNEKANIKTSVAFVAGMQSMIWAHQNAATQAGMTQNAIAGVSQLPSTLGAKAVESAFTPPEQGKPAAPAKKPAQSSGKSAKRDDYE